MSGEWKSLLAAIYGEINEDIRGIKNGGLDLGLKVGFN